MLCLCLFYLPLIERLVGSDGHHDLVANAEEKKSALGQVQGDLADDLIEALGEELLTDGADATLSSLTLHKLLIKHFSQSGDIDSRGGLMTHILNPVLACIIQILSVTASILFSVISEELLTLFNPFPWWQDCVQDVFLFGSVLHGRQLSLSLRGCTGA